MAKTAFIIFSTMIALLLSAASWADIYRCTVDGKVQYTDRPCADGDVVVKSQPDKSRNNSAETRSARDQNDVMRNQPAAVTAPIPEFGSTAIPREPPLWERRNMSVVCFGQKYNAWSAGRSTRPTEEERDRKISELMRECREIYRIPQDTPPRGVASQ